MSKVPRKPPAFKSRQEEREFWDAHDLMDYFDSDDFVPLATLVEGAKLAHIYVAPDGTRYELRRLPPRVQRKPSTAPRARSVRSTAHRAALRAK